MDQGTRNNRQYLQRNHPRTEEEEEYHQNRSRPTRSTSTEKTKHQRRFKRIPTHIINLSIHQLTPGETSLLSKGLNFIPTPNKEHPAKPLQDTLLFDRKLRLKYYFYQDTITEPTEEDNMHNDILHPSSGWTPSSGQDPFLESYRSTILQKIKGRTTGNLKEIWRKKNRKLLPHSETIKT